MFSTPLLLTVRPLAVASIAAVIECEPASTVTPPRVRVSVLAFVEAMVVFGTRLLNSRPAIETGVSRLTVAPALALSENVATLPSPGTVLFQLAAVVQLPPFWPAQ